MSSRLKDKVQKEFLQSLQYLGSWTLVALVSAPIAVVTVSLFLITITWVKAQLPVSSPMIILIAVIGAAVAALISRIDPRSRGEGIPSYIRGVRDDGGYLSFKASAVKLFSSFATLAAWGNGGLVGPLGRVVAGFTSNLIGLFRAETGGRSLRRTAAICGLASIVAALTGAPLGSGIFAVEIIQKRNMRYSDLFPAVLSASIAVFISRYFSYNQLFDLKVSDYSIELRILPALLVTALLAALGGRAFEMFYGKASRMMRRDRRKGVELRFIAAAAIAVGITWLANPNMLGTGRDYFHLLFQDPSVVSGRLGTGVPLAFAALLMILVRAVSVGLTVGSGQSAGFFGPLAQIGMLIGTFTAFLFGYAGNPGDLHILQAAGLAGLIASSLNVPLAAAIIVSEVFGPQLGFPAAIAAILGFQLNRHHTVYDVTLEEKYPGGRRGSP
jgi:CIC family chloride channel protein